MKIVVIGGHGRIGSKIVDKLRDDGHDAVAADLNTGVNTLTGEGLAEALDGADAVASRTASTSSSATTSARAPTRATWSPTPTRATSGRR